MIRKLAKKKRKKLFLILQNNEFQKSRNRFSFDQTNTQEDQIKMQKEAMRKQEIFPFNWTFKSSDKLSFNSKNKF